MKKNTLYSLVGTAMLSAAAFVLMFIEFPLLAAAPYLKMDFSDFPCFIAAVVFGPGYGIASELIKNVIDLIIKGFGTQMGFGNILNFLVGCAYIIPFSIIMKKSKSEKFLVKFIISTAVSVVSILIVGFFGNYVFAPFFFKYFLGTELTGAEALAAASVSIPFNAIKAAILSVIIFILWKPLIEKLPKIFH